MSKDNKYVYLVEDALVQRKMCRNILKHLGFQVRDYANAEALLSHINSDQESFLANAAVVITDFNLSSKLYDGGDLTQILRGMSADLIIIGISAASEADMVSGEGALQVFAEKGATRAVNKEYFTQDPRSNWKRILQEEGIFQWAGVVTEAEEKENEDSPVPRIGQRSIRLFGQEEGSGARISSSTFNSDTVRVFYSYESEDEHNPSEEGEHPANTGKKLEQTEVKSRYFMTRILNPGRSRLDMVHSEKGASNQENSDDEGSKKSKSPNDFEVLSPKVLDETQNGKNNVSEVASQSVVKCCSISPCSSLVTVVAYVGRGVASCFGYKRSSMPVVCGR